MPIVIKIIWSIFACILLVVSGAVINMDKDSETTKVIFCLAVLVYASSVALNIFWKG